MIDECSISSAWRQATSGMGTCSYIGSMNRFKVDIKLQFLETIRRMHNGKRVKMEAACKSLLATTSSASTTVSGTTLLKKSRYRQNFHGVAI